MYSYGKPSGLGAKGVSKDEAKRAVQNIYLELLLRDPWGTPYDQGAEGYVNCLTEGWCNTDFVRTEVIKSSEYKDKELARAQSVYGTGGTASSAAAGGSSAAMPYDASSYAPIGGITSMTVAGIPVVYLAGGVVLLMLLKKR
jgi:hypothetical protein